MEQSFEQLVMEALTKSLSEAGLHCAQFEAIYKLTLAELQAFKSVLEYDPALKELFEETQAKMKGNNA